MAEAFIINTYVRTSLSSFGARAVVGLDPTMTEEARIRFLIKDIGAKIIGLS